MPLTQNGPWESKPNRQSILFNGRYISLMGIARGQNIHQSYLSRIFSGERVPSINHAKKLSAALGMGLEEFLEALDERVKTIEAKRKRIVSQYDSRLKREQAEDVATAKAGRPVLPRTHILKSLV